MLRPRPVFGGGNLDQVGKCLLLNQWPLCKVYNTRMEGGLNKEIPGGREEHFLVEVKFERSLVAEVW